MDRNPDLKPQPGVIYYGCVGSEATMYVCTYTGMFGRALLENHWHWTSSFVCTKWESLTSPMLKYGSNY